MKHIPLTLVTLFITYTLSLTASTPLTWDDLITYTVTENKQQENTILNYNKKDISIGGFIVPLDFSDDFYSVKEFLLVPDPLACIHVPPPPPNQMIHVIMNKKIPLDMDLRGVEITGTFYINNQQTEYGDVYYKMDGKKAEALELTFEIPFDELDEFNDIDDWTDYDDFDEFNNMF